MRKGVLSALEAAGVFAASAMTLFLSGLYELSRGNPIGILFGSVNSSVWERLKPVVLSYVLFAFVELLSVRPNFRRFTVCKTAGLCTAILLFIPLSFATESLALDAVSALLSPVALFAGFLTSYALFLCGKELRGFFSLSCFTLLFIFVCWFSFTAAPPRLPLFLDPVTGMYGVIPEHIDFGSLALFGGVEK